VYPSNLIRVMPAKGAHVVVIDEEKTIGFNGVAVADVVRVLGGRRVLDLVDVRVAAGDTQSGWRGRRARFVRACRGERRLA
jgi:hypothetical protein